MTSQCSLARTVMRKSHTQKVKEPERQPRTTLFTMLFGSSVTPFQSWETGSGIRE